ncbi:GM-CSF/IL-2 inhibitory factor [Bovine papular stomatitis virus]
MLRALLALSVLVGTAAHRGMCGGGEFCRAHARDIFTSFQMWMRIQRNVQTAGNATQCALDVESPPEIIDAVASANVDLSVDVRTLQALYGANKSSMFARLDTWSPVDEAHPPLYSNASAHAHNDTINCPLEVLDLNRVHGDPIDHPRVEDPGLLRHVVPKNRKQNPGHAFVNMSADRRRVHSVAAKTVLWDACVHHKNETPLNFYGRENFPLHKSPDSVIPTHERGSSTCATTTGR